MRLFDRLAVNPSGGVEHGEAVRIGALVENPGLYSNMTAFENMRCKAMALGLVDSVAEIERLLRIVGLADAGKKPAKSYSLGMKQRLGLALALLGSPDVLLLDEPMNGLDPEGRARDAQPHHLLERAARHHRGGELATCLTSWSGWSRVTA